MIIYLCTWPCNQLLLPGPPIYKIRPKHLATPEIDLLWSIFDSQSTIGVSIYTINGDPRRDCPIRGPQTGTIFPRDRDGDKYFAIGTTRMGTRIISPAPRVPTLRKLQNCPYILRNPNNSVPLKAETLK